MECSPGGVVKNCSGCKKRHEWLFGKYCTTYVARLAARAGNEEPVTLQAGVEDKDGQDVLTELHKQIVQEKSRRLELLQAEQVVTLE